MTLPNEEVLDLLEERFVLGHRNIEKEEHVGMSHGYKCTDSAVGTTNGAGGRNVQFVVLAADGTVLHALPGFWHAEDLVPELQLALEVHRLHETDSMSQRRKQQMFAALHQAHLRHHRDEAASRSRWQGFDRAYEMQRLQNEPRDTFRQTDDGTMVLKSIPEVVHDRLLAQPFQPFDEFDMEAFVDYGRPFYDNNQGIDRGRSFRRAERANAKREAEKAKAAKAAQRLAEKEARRNKRASN